MQYDYSDIRLKVIVIFVNNKNYICHNLSKSSQPNEDHLDQIMKLTSMRSILTSVLCMDVLQRHSAPGDSSVYRPETGQRPLRWSPSEREKRGASEREIEANDARFKIVRDHKAWVKRDAEHSWDYLGEITRLSRH